MDDKGKLSVVSDITLPYDTMARLWRWVMIADFDQEAWPSGGLEPRQPSQQPTPQQQQQQQPAQPQNKKGKNAPTPMHPAAVEAYTAIAEVLAEGADGPRFWEAGWFSSVRDEERNEPMRFYYFKGEDAWEPYERAAFYVHFFRNAVVHQKKDRERFFRDMPAGASA